MCLLKKYDFLKTMMTFKLEATIKYKNKKLEDVEIFDLRLM